MAEKSKEIGFFKKICCYLEEILNIGLNFPMLSFMIGISHRVAILLFSFSLISFDLITMLTVIDQITHFQLDISFATINMYLLISSISETSEYHQSNKTRNLIINQNIFNPLSLTLGLHYKKIINNSNGDL